MKPRPSCYGSGQITPPKMVDGAPPLQALPPVLMTSDPGSFARATIVDQ